MSGLKRKRITKEKPRKKQKNEQGKQQKDWMILTNGTELIIKYDKYYQFSNHRFLIKNGRRMDPERTRLLFKSGNKEFLIKKFLVVEDTYILSFDIPSFSEMPILKEDLPLIYEVELHQKYNNEWIINSNKNKFTIKIKYEKDDVVDFKKIKNPETQENILNLLMNKVFMQKDHKVSAIHLPIISGDKKLIRDLLAEDFDINAKDADGNTPLHLAALYKNNDLYHWLIKKGADETIKNKSEKKPKHYLTVDQVITLD